ncbi:MAG: hypothetical protein JXA60_03795 [Candidatus Coatesbacteria bacterium]|nr:hypothetical protein [Candidatus Coatesbacteria bacterium]
MVILSSGFCFDCKDKKENITEQQSLTLKKIDKIDEDRFIEIYLRLEKIRDEFPKDKLKREEVVKNYLDSIGTKPQELIEFINKQPDTLAWPKIWNKISKKYAEINPSRKAIQDTTTRNEDKKNQEKNKKTDRNN